MSSVVIEEEIATNSLVTSFPSEPCKELDRFPRGQPGHLASFIVDEPCRARIIERETRARWLADREALIALERGVVCPAASRTLPRRLSHAFTDVGCSFSRKSG